MSGLFPVAPRVAEVVQAVVIALSPEWCSRERAPRCHAGGGPVWIAVALGAVSLVLDLVTPSGGERLAWAPIGFLMLVSGVVVATGKATRKRTVAPT